MKLLSFLLFYLGISLQAEAAIIKARAGEHEGFTRVVFYVPSKISWTSHFRENGIDLSYKDKSVELQISKFFSRLSKDRVVSINQDKENKNIFVRFGCKCTARKFTTPDGLVVFDITENNAEILHARPNVVLPLFPTHFSTKKRPLPSETIFFPSNIMDENPEISGQSDTVLHALSQASKVDAVQVENHRIQSPFKNAFSKLSGDPGIDFKTSHDSDLITKNAFDPITESGNECPADEAFDLLSWQTEDPFYDRLAQLQMQLLEEFDLSDLDTGINIIRHYLVHGMAAEAEEFAKSFELVDRIDPKYSALSDIIRNGKATTQNYFDAFATCPNNAALWAVLSKNNPSKNDKTNVEALRYATMALPPTLKQVLAPIVSEKLMGAGDDDGAKNLLELVKTTSPEKIKSIELGLAEYDLKTGRDEHAMARLENLVHIQAENAPNALIELVALKAKLHREVSPYVADLAEALQWNHRTESLGKKLEFTHALALLMSGQDQKAYALFSSIASDHKDVNLFADLMIARATDPIFLTFAVNLPSEIRPETAGRAATRLLDLGFAREVNKLVTLYDPSNRTSEMKIADASALVMMGEPEHAIKIITALPPDKHNAEKGDILMATKKYKQALQVYLKLGDQQRALHASWNARDKESLQTLGRPDLAAMLDLKDTNKIINDSPLITGINSIQNSEKLREKLRTALDQDDILHP